MKLKGFIILAFALFSTINLYSQEHHLSSWSNLIEQAEERSLELQIIDLEIETLESQIEIAEADEGFSFSAPVSSSDSSTSQSGLITYVTGSTGDLVRGNPQVNLSLAQSLGSEIELTLPYSINLDDSSETSFQPELTYSQSLDQIIGLDRDTSEEQLLIELEELYSERELLERSLQDDLMEILSNIIELDISLLEHKKELIELEEELRTLSNRYDSDSIEIRSANLEINEIVRDKKQVESELALEKSSWFEMTGVAYDSLEQSTAKLEEILSDYPVIQSLDNGSFQFGSIPQVVFDLMSSIELSLTEIEQELRDVFQDSSIERDEIVAAISRISSLATIESAERTIAKNQLVLDAYKYEMVPEISFDLGSTLLFQENEADVFDTINLGLNLEVASVDLALFANVGVNSADTNLGFSVTWNPFESKTLDQEILEAQNNLLISELERADLEYDSVMDLQSAIDDLDRALLDLIYQFESLEIADAQYSLDNERFNRGILNQTELDISAIELSEKAYGMIQTILETQIAKNQISLLFEGE